MKRRRTAAKKSTSTPHSPTEHAEQVGFVNWFRIQFPDVLIFAIPNGGRRSVGQGKKLKAEGVVAGIPDLFVPEWSLWIEMKKEKGGQLSTHQKACIKYLESINNKVIIGKGARDASKQVLEYVNEYNTNTSRQIL